MKKQYETVDKISKGKESNKKEGCEKCYNFLLAMINNIEIQYFMECLSIQKYVQVYRLYKVKYLLQYYRG